jgi:hypothetical protein
MPFLEGQFLAIAVTNLAADWHDEARTVLTSRL